MFQVFLAVLLRGLSVLPDKQRTEAALGIEAVGKRDVQDGAARVPKDISTDGNRAKLVDVAPKRVGKIHVQMVGETLRLFSQHARKPMQSERLVPVGRLLLHETREPCSELRG